MLSVYHLKPAFQQLLRPCVARLAKHHVTANQVTIAAAILSLVTGLIILFNPTKPAVLLLVPLVLFLRMALNAIDGLLAREHNMQSRLGVFLNELGDIFSDTFLYLPFSLVPFFSPILIVSIVILAIISETTGIIAIQAGGSRRYEGPMGKSDRALVFGLIGLLLGVGINIHYWVNFILGVVCLLLIVTIIRRVKLALKENRT